MAWIYGVDQVDSYQSEIGADQRSAPTTSRVKLSKAGWGGVGGGGGAGGGGGGGGGGGPPPPRGVSGPPPNRPPPRHPTDCQPLTLTLNLRVQGAALPTNPTLRTSG